MAHYRDNHQHNSAHRKLYFPIHFYFTILKVLKKLKHIILSTYAYKKKLFLLIP